MASDAAVATKRSVADEAVFSKRRGWSGQGLLANLAILAGAAISPIVSGPLVVLWAKWSRTPWREIGYVRPKSWIVAIAGGIVSGIALKLVMKAIVLPLLGANPINRSFHSLATIRKCLLRLSYTSHLAPVSARRLSSGDICSNGLGDFSVTADRRRSQL